MVYNPFNVLMNLVCQYFVENYCIYIHQEFRPVICSLSLSPSLSLSFSLSLSHIVFVWFWYQDNFGFIQWH